MARLNKGVWEQEDMLNRQSTEGDDQFHSWLSADKSARFPAEPGRYHLYLSKACPFAHRTHIGLMLKGLDRLIDISFAAPRVETQGWTYTEEYSDKLYGISHLHELYCKAKVDFSGRVSVPVLWDKQSETIVSTESADILRMFNYAFKDLVPQTIDLYPEALRQDIDAMNKQVFIINRGVYRCGFAKEQIVYEEAYERLFTTLDEFDDRLAKQTYLLGDQLTESDIRLFTSLLRFDPVYYLLFKCNKKFIADYDNLSRYLKTLSQLPEIAKTIDIEQIKIHYFYTMAHINPTRIVPKGPE